MIIVQDKTEDQSNQDHVNLKRRAEQWCHRTLLSNCVTDKLILIFRPFRFQCTGTRVYSDSWSKHYNQKTTSIWNIITSHPSSIGISAHSDSPHPRGRRPCSCSWSKARIWDSLELSSLREPLGSGPPYTMECNLAPEDGCDAFSKVSSSGPSLARDWCKVSYELTLAIRWGKPLTLQHSRFDSHFS